MLIDLHVHSTASDGTVPPAKVVRAAGVDVLALTDHDTLAGLPAAIAALPAGLTLVPGVELSCAADRAGRRTSVHLLGYLVDATEPALAAELTRLRGDRERRARVMVEKARTAGAGVTWEQVANIADGAPVGRPHVARALLAAGAIGSYDDAFGPEWIGPGGRAYEPKHALDPVDGVRLVLGAGGVPVLAHPGGRRPVPDEVLAEMAAAGLVGVEVDHPEHDAPARDRLRGLATDLGLLVTGGSDFHGSVKPTEIGDETTEISAYQALVAAATGARPVRR